MRGCVMANRNVPECPHAVMTFKEIAVALGLPCSTVVDLYSTAMRKLAQDCRSVEAFDLMVMRDNQIARCTPYRPPVRTAGLLERD